MILRMLRRKEKEQEKQKKVARKGWDEVEKIVGGAMKQDDEIGR